MSHGVRHVTQRGKGRAARVSRSRGCDLQKGMWLAFMAFDPRFSGNWGRLRNKDSGGRCLHVRAGGPWSLPSHIPQASICPSISNAVPLFAPPPFLTFFPFFPYPTIQPLPNHSSCRLHGARAGGHIGVAAFGKGRGLLQRGVVRDGA
jgi:hypothetical protein